MSEPKSDFPGLAELSQVNGQASGQLNQANCSNFYQHGLGQYFQPGPSPSFDEAIRIAKTRLGQIERELSNVDALKKEAAKLKKLLAAAGE